MYALFYICGGFFLYLAIQRQCNQHHATASRQKMYVLIYQILISFIMNYYYNEWIFGCTETN